MELPSLHKNLFLEAEISSAEKPSLRMWFRQDNLEPSCGTVTKMRPLSVRASIKISNWQIETLIDRTGESTESFSEIGPEEIELLSPSTDSNKI